MIVYYGICPTALTDPRPIITPARPVRRESRETIRARNPRRNAAEIEAWVFDGMRKCQSPVSAPELALKLATTRHYAHQCLMALLLRGRVDRARNVNGYVWWRKA